MNERRICTTAITAVALAVACPAAADDMEQQAQVLWEKGAGHFELGEYDQALDLITRAFAYTKNPIYHFNIGRCHEMMGDVEKALRTYEQVEQSKMSREERRSLAAKIAEMKAILKTRGTLEIAGGVPGTRVTVDGKLAGTTPLDPLHLKPGAYTVVLAPPDRPGKEQQVTLAEGRTVKLDLDVVFPKITTGQLLFVGGLQGDMLRVDGIDMGKVPAHAIELRDGTHSVAVERGGRTFETPIVIRAGREHSVTIVFPETASKGPSPWPWIVGGTGLGAGLVGLVFTVVANRQYDEYKSDPTGSANLLESSKDNDTVAYALYGVGGALLVTGVVLYFALPRGGAERAASLPAIEPLPGGAIVRCSLGF